MIKLLEVVETYNDTWQITFYYIMVLIFLVGIFWTYMQVFVKKAKPQKKPLKENIIYQHSEDIIEEYDLPRNAKKNYKKKTNVTTSSNKKKSTNSKNNKTKKGKSKEKSTNKKN